VVRISRQPVAAGVSPRRKRWSADIGSLISTRASNRASHSASGSATRAAIASVRRRGGVRSTSKSAPPAATIASAG
jgi:hypothetical protein